MHISVGWLLVCIRLTCILMLVGCWGCTRLTCILVLVGCWGCIRLTCILVLVGCWGCIRLTFILVLVGVTFPCQLVPPTMVPSPSPSYSRLTNWYVKE